MWHCGAARIGRPPQSRSKLDLEERLDDVRWLRRHVSPRLVGLDDFRTYFLDDLMTLAMALGGVVPRLE